MSWDAARGGGDSTWNTNGEGGSVWSEGKEDNALNNDSASNNVEGENTNGGPPNDGACFNCGEQGSVKSKRPRWLLILQIAT